MSLIEVMVALGLLGGITFVFTNLTQTQSNNQVSAKQDDLINATFEIISQALSEKISCNALIGTTPDPNGIDVSTISATFPINNTNKISYAGARTFAPTGLGSGVRSAGMEVWLRFEKELPDGKRREVNLRTQATVQYNDGTYVGCVDAEEEMKRDSLRTVCRMIGGDFIDSGSGTERCDLRSIDPNSNFSNGLREVVCSELFKGDYDQTTLSCSRLEVSGPVITGNLQSDRLRIGTAWRNNFDQMCSGTNNFVRAISPGGAVTCINVTYCTPGRDCGSVSPNGGNSNGIGGSCTPNCSCADTVAVGSSCIDSACGTSCPGLSCDHLDRYSITGDVHRSENEWALGTQSCEFSNVPSIASDGSCSSPSVSTIATAGPCQKFDTGTCNGSRAGRVVNVADGTSCGNGNTCQAGVCGSGTDDCDSPPPFNYTFNDGISSCSLLARSRPRALKNNQMLTYGPQVSHSQFGAKWDFNSPNGVHARGRLICKNGSYVQDDLYNACSRSNYFTLRNQNPDYDKAPSNPINDQYNTPALQNIFGIK